MSARSFVDDAALTAMRGTSIVVRCGRPFQSRTCLRILCEIRSTGPLDGPVVRFAYPGDRLFHKPSRRPQIACRETDGDEWGAARIEVVCACGASWVLRSDRTEEVIISKLLEATREIDPVPWPRRRSWYEMMTTELVGR